MKNQTIKLDCGHEVEVIAIDIRRTYGEFLAGEPTLEDNMENPVKLTTTFQSKLTTISGAN